MIGALLNEENFECWHTVSSFCYAKIFEQNDICFCNLPVRLVGNGGGYGYGYGPPIMLLKITAISLPNINRLFLLSRRCFYN